MFKLPNQSHKKVTKGRFSHSREEASPGTPLYRKKLDGGIRAEANNDGTIFVNKNIEKGSPLEAEVVAHEGDHMARMEKGELDYSDNNVTWRGKKYDRKDGKILYNGQWREEGWKEFPWEKLAYKVGTKTKKEAEKKNT